MGSHARSRDSLCLKGSTAYSVSSARVKAAAKLAVLGAEAANLKSVQAIQKK